MKQSWCHGPSDASGAPMRLFVGPPAIRSGESETDVHFALRLGRDASDAALLDTLSFRVNAVLDPRFIGIEPALAVALPMAMARCWDLVAEAPVAPEFPRVLAHYARISVGWLDDWRIPEMHLPVADAAVPMPAARGEGAFFSGGVDSFHALWRLRQSLGHAIFIAGFDIEPAKSAHARLAAAKSREAAALFGLDWIRVDTNARALRHYPESWVHTGGSVLAAVALLLRGRFRRVHVASDSTWLGCITGHDHPFLHQLWRLPGFALSCTGVSIPRITRVGELGAGKPAALPLLRVCWEMDADHLNCGRCEKCQRTLFALEAHGLRDQAAPAFRVTDLDWPMVLAMRPDAMRRPYYEQIAAVARRNGRDDLADRLDPMLVAARRVELLRSLAPMGKELVATDAWKKKHSRFRDTLFAALLALDADWLWAKLRRHRARWRGVLAPIIRPSGLPGWSLRWHSRWARFRKHG